MKPLNSAERKAYRLQFTGMYIISVALILIILSAFLPRVPSAKTALVQQEKPARVITKTVVVTKQSVAVNNYHELDSIKAIINFNKHSIDTLNSIIQSQNNVIAALKNQSATHQPATNTITTNNEVIKLKKQIEFYDWALRSQVAVTNTLTKENHALKNKIEQLKKNN